MLKALLVVVLLLISTNSFAGRVNGYYRSNGTYVQSYNRSNADSTVQDNYSYKGNVNPYTGSVGQNYYRNSPTSQYYGSTSGLQTMQPYAPSNNYGSGTSYRDQDSGSSPSSRQVFGN